MKKIIISILIMFMMIGSVFAVLGNGQGNSPGMGLRDGTGKGQSMGGQHSQAGYVYQIYDDTNVNHEEEINSYPLENLSQSEISSLIKMREEEKLARDVYLEMYDIYEMQIFSNIARSEERHTLAIKSLLERYEIEDPVLNDVRGEFTNEELQKLYLVLIEKGSQNLSSALVIGATVEDLDIKDLQDDLENIDNQDITAVYNNLMKGSRNHLRSYTRTLERTSGEIYAPQYISSEYFESVVSSDMESGNNFNKKDIGYGSNFSLKEKGQGQMRNNQNNIQINTMMQKDVVDEKKNSVVEEDFFSRIWRGFGNWFE